MKISILGTTASGTLIFRCKLITQLVSLGHEVTVFCTDYSARTITRMQSLGAKPVSYQLERGGVNPLADLQSLRQLHNLFKRIQPDVTLSCFVKPSIYGSIAARWAGVPRRLAMLEGLGYVFTDLPSGITLKQKTLRKIQLFLYRLALPSIDDLIFLNPDDPIDLLHKNGLRAKSVKILGGIGLDLEEFPYRPARTDPIKFIFIGRLLAEKGIFEYIEAAKIIKKQRPDVEFIVLGDMDEENPGGLKEHQLKELLETGTINYPGYVENVSEWISWSSVFVLPSYREGVPRSTQEAMAIGRAVITTDVPGCRETVEEGVNGFLVPRWNAPALAEKMLFFIRNPEEILRMGDAGHKMAVEKFDAEKVNERLIHWLTG